MTLQRFCRHTLRFCFAVTSLFLFSDSAEALTGTTGVKAMGMGGCAIACPQEAMSLAWNPAVGVYIGNRFDVNASWLQTRGEATVFDNLTLGTPPVSALFKSNVHPNVFDGEFGINYIVCGSYDVALGLVGYNKNYIQTHYSDAVPFLGDTQLGMELIQEVISPSLSIRLDCHYFGVAIQFAGQRFKANGVENFARDTLSITADAVTGHGHDYAWGAGLVAGWLWKAYPGVRMGFVYETKTYMSRFERYRGFLPHRGRLHMPERFSLGFGFDFTCYFHGAIDLQLVRWSRTGLKRRTPFSSTPIELTSIESLQSAGNCACPKRRGFGLGWRDQPFIRAGLDYHIPCIRTVLRAGYRWARTPIRSFDTVANLLTLETTQNVLSIGATATPWDRHELSFAYAYGFNHTVRGNRSRPISPFFGGGFADLRNGLQFVKIGYEVHF